MVHRRFVLMALLVATICALVMAPGVSGGFLFDDFTNIVFNQKIHVTQWTVSTFRDALHAYEGSIGRPFATLSFAFNYWLDGLNPIGFKIGNLLLHVANILLVAYLLRLILSLLWISASENSIGAAALLGAALWGVHPIQVSAVLYVVQRMELMAASCIFVSLILYCRGRMRQIEGRHGGWRLVSVSAVVAAFGLTCKETAALVPLLSFGMELTVFRFAGARIGNHRILAWLYGAGLLVAAGVYAFWLVPDAGAAYVSRNFTMVERLYTQLRVLPMYLTQIAWPAPSNLIFYYDGLHQSTSLFSPISTFWGGVSLVALAIAAVLFRKSAPLSSLGIYFFFAAHALTSGVIPLEHAFEHRNYLALLGVVLVLVDIGLRCAQKLPSRIVVFFASGILLCLATTTVFRSLVWGNPLVLASSAVHDAPDSPRASYEMGILFIERSGADPASVPFALGMASLSHAAELPLSSPLPLQAIILVNYKTGQPVDPQLWERLFAKFRTRAIGSQELSAYYTLMGERMSGLNIPDERLRELSGIIIDRRPDIRDVHIYYADFARKNLHDDTVALHEYRAAIALTKRSERAALVAKIVLQLRAEGDRSLADLIKLP